MLQSKSCRSLAPGATPVVAMTADGAATVVTNDDVLRITGGRVLMPAAGVVGVAGVDRALWIVTADRDEHTLHRFTLAGEPMAPAAALGALGKGVTLSAVRIGARAALIEGSRAVLVRERGLELCAEPLGERGRDRRILIGARGVAERRGGVLVLSRAGAPVELPLPADLQSATLVGGSIAFDGAAALFEVEAHGRRTALVYDLRGPLRTRIRLGEASIMAVAERTGLVVLGRGPHLALLDLRAGSCIGERILPAPAVACAIDAAGSRLVVIDGDGNWCELGPSMADVDGPAAAAPAVAEDDDAPTPTPTPAPAPAPPIVAAASAAPVSEPSPELAAAARVRLRGLGPLPAGARLTADDLDVYLADLRAWIDAVCRTALAVAWDSGRIARPSADAEAVTRARALEDEARVRLDRWCGRGVPHVELARELGLSSTATTLLLLIAAPQIWGELARTYGVLAADPARPLVDELLLAHLLEAETAARSEIGCELDDGAPLLATGAIVVARGLRPYAGLSAHAAIARRLAGVPTAGDPDDARALDELLGPRADIAALARRLARPGSAPARVVLRGRAASGRRTLAASLAAQASRAIGVVTVEARGPDIGVGLRQRLRDVALRGDLPCVSLDDLPDDPSVRGQVRAVLDGHAGPLFVRAPLEGDLPLAPGYAAVGFRPLSETERRDAWRGILGERELDVGVADELAARFAVGPGAMARACAALDAAPAADLAGALATQLRQHRSARIQSIASEVTRLATWDELVVPEEIADALREMIARVRHRRTVLETWGMDQVAATAQGVTALFQGGPGTGKTMAAGLVARELGHELWRVDLSKVVSKWIGETEKNLAAVFDAAEDGEIVLLFDEADALFGKRTDVKSSHDRNANLETNYLLQRLDTFSGVAILTTNFGTAIDPAFRRRLSVHVQFPFPNEEERERLWRAHLPASLPAAAELDLAALSRKHALSGGYIRNAALRAAYLAAAECGWLTSEHLQRAVALEYQRAGKLGDGRLE